MEHILDFEKQFDELIPIFQKIAEGNTILFLGAGASVGEKRYLSKEVIQYYEAYLGKNYSEPNITRFVDILSADEKFTRSHFDNEAVKYLHKLDLTESHKIVAAIPWREIITTNFDLLIERAYDEINKTSEKIYDLKIVRNVKQYYYRESNAELKYIKLNGCIQDVSLYPLAFSTDDFKKLRTFYKTVLNDLRNLSESVSFLSVGYSYGDDFGKELLDKFDSFNFRDRKWIINVDPYPNVNALAYYKQNRIQIVKCSFQEFFLKFQEWQSKKAENLVKKKGLFITNSRNNQISVPHKLLINLDGIIKQLNSNTKERFIKEIDFYKGEEPTFNLITRGVDVIKSKYISKFQESIVKVLEDSPSTFVPIFFITGDFGIGKSTFALRLIFELEKVQEMDLVAFEIEDFTRLKKEIVIDLINCCESKNLLLFCDELEVESYFKTLLELQRDLSIEQFLDVNVFFIVPIRENILEKYKLNRSIPRSHEIKLDGHLEPDEIEDLLVKLKNAGLVDYRDANEKMSLIKKVQKEYSSDSFITLMGIITAGKHENDLVSCYKQLSSEAQKAFLYTALLHKHKLLMPANWLKQNISMNWDEFTEKVIRAEGRGILIQEVRASHGTEPDLFFRTKHPLIASKLVDRFIPSYDKQYTFYEKMLKTIDLGQTNSYLANNLLKAFYKNDVYSETNLNNLYDITYNKLSDDPYFLLNYAINLQNRRGEGDYKKAIDLLVYAESLLEYRNHRFIHRRGVLNFELAKYYFTQESELNDTMYHLNEAKELFITKQLCDSVSSYSYYDFIKMLVWELDNIEFDVEDKMQVQILIEELFDLSSKLVTYDIERINSLQALYADFKKEMSGDADYYNYLYSLYSQPNLRPYACILLFNLFYEKEDVEKCKVYFEEMEGYQENLEVIKFLFKFYGRNLHDPNMRVKLLRLSRENPILEKGNPLRYNFYNFIAESYNFQHFEAKKYLQNIKSHFLSLNPEFHFVWSDQDGEEQIFKALLIRNFGEKHKAVKISNIQLTVRLIKGNYERFNVGATVRVKLHFYLYGLMAEIISIVESHSPLQK